jgi:hypothetical protein
LGLPGSVASSVGHHHAAKDGAERLRATLSDPLFGNQHRRLPVA